MTDKPFTVGGKYIDSGFVHDLSDNKTNEHYFLRAHVWPSLQSDFPHNVNIILSRNVGLLSMLLALHAKSRNLVDVAMLW